MLDLFHARNHVSTCPRVFHERLPGFFDVPNSSLCEQFNSLFKVVTIEFVVAVVVFQVFVAVVLHSHISSLTSLHAPRPPSMKQKLAPSLKAMSHVRSLAMLQLTSYYYNKTRDFLSAQEEDMLNYATTCK